MIDVFTWHSWPIHPSPYVHTHKNQETPTVVVDQLMEEGASYQRSSVMVRGGLPCLPACLHLSIPIHPLRLSGIFFCVCARARSPYTLFFHDRWPLTSLSCVPAYVQ